MHVLSWIPFCGHTNPVFLTNQSATNSSPTPFSLYNFSCGFTLGNHPYSYRPPFTYLDPPTQLSTINPYFLPTPLPPPAWARLVVRYIKLLRLFFVKYRISGSSICMLSPPPYLFSSPFIILLSYFLFSWFLLPFRPYFPLPLGLTLIFTPFRLLLLSSFFSSSSCLPVLLNASSLLYGTLFFFSFLFVSFSVSVYLSPSLSFSLSLSLSLCLSVSLSVSLSLCRCSHQCSTKNSI